MGSAIITETSAAQSDRESIGAVRSTRSEQREKITALAMKVEEDAMECLPPQMPHFKAAVMAQALEQVPFVSVALEAHQLCLQAAREDLDDLGFCSHELMDLAAALAEILDHSGLRLEKGGWKIKRSDREAILEEPLPFVAALAFDVERVLEEIP